MTLIEIGCATAIVVTLLAVPPLASAQTDEIQVYDGGLAAVGTLNLTLHSNFTPRGLATPAFPGAVIADKSFNGVPEWALGVTPWFEAGLYLPLYSRDKDTGWGLDGFKLRALFAVPKADDRTFFYGANFEFSFNAKRWDTKGFTSEIRPIVGWHLKPVDIIVNPIVDTAYDGFGNLEFVPAARVAYNFRPDGRRRWRNTTTSVRCTRFSRPPSRRTRCTRVVDRTWKTWDIEAGVGVGMTDSSDRRHPQADPLARSQQEMI